MKKIKSVKELLKNEKIEEIAIYDVLKDSFLAYAPATVVRMLPNAIDGLKETQRKILYVMWKEGIYKMQKNNKVIGDVVPYVDTGNDPIYGALIRMGQRERFHKGLALIEAQGNTGYIAGGFDEYAAQRYTESHLSEFTRDIYFPEDIKSSIMNTNYSGELSYPRALPSILPMGIVLGTTGVCTGYKNDCPPHTLKGVGKAYIRFIEDLNTITKKANYEKYLEKNIYPSFPNGCIPDTKGYLKGLITGKGRISAVGKYKIKEYSYGRKIVEITELPYMVTTPSFVNSIKANAMCKDLFIDIKDYSNKEGILIELITRKETTNAQIKDFLTYGTNFYKIYNYSLIYNDSNLARRMGILDLFKTHYDFKIDSIKRYYLDKFIDTTNKRMNYIALKFVLENEERRNKFFDILKKSDMDTIYEKMNKAFKKDFPQLNNNIIDFLINSRFTNYMNKAKSLSDTISKLDEDLKEITFRRDNPDKFLIKEIDRIITKYKF